MVDKFDEILGIIALISFIGIFVSLICAVIDVWYVQSLIREIKERRADKKSTKLPR